VSTRYMGKRIAFPVLILMLCGACIAGCSIMPSQPIVAVSTVSASVPSDEVHLIDRGGILWLGDVNLVFLSVDSDGGEPVARMGVGSKSKPELNSEPLSLRLGETADVPGLASVTLLSFDDDDGVQAITVRVSLSG